MSPDRPKLLINNEKDFKSSIKRAKRPNAKINMSELASDHSSQDESMRAIPLISKNLTFNEKNSALKSPGNLKKTRNRPFSKRVFSNPPKLSPENDKKVGNFSYSALINLDCEGEICNQRPV